MQNRYAEKLIEEYSIEKKDTSKLDQLKSLDKKVKTPAYAFAYIFGILGTLVLGVGMSLAMEIFGPSTIFMIIGIVVGIVGIAMVSINYSIFKNILKKRKEKYAHEILARSNELLNN